MARGLADVLDAFIDGPRPRVRSVQRILRVPLAPASRVAAELVASIAAQLPRLGVSVSLKLLDAGARSLQRVASGAPATPAELTLEIATCLVAAPRAKSVLLVCPDLASALRLGAELVVRDPDCEIVVLDCATGASESAAIRWLVERSGMRWIASVPPSSALRASLGTAASNAAVAQAGRALRSWLRASHP
jgi:hypothetical protein